jgi:NIMA (never in mitosis gene a)-related kinase
VLVSNEKGKELVMKQIDISKMGNKERSDAINEVKVLSQLKHPYIVSYHQSFIDGGTLCILMDYAENGDLSNLIVNTRRCGHQLPEQQILRWLTQIALAIKYMHDKHILHRDLKSQNIFLTAQRRAQVGDFGIARVLESTSAFAQTKIGTPYYLSPEICQDRPYSYASDVWALGCILHEMCALRVPFDATNIKQLVEKITRGHIPACPQGFSQETRTLVEQLLNRNPSQRPSAADVLNKPLLQSMIRELLTEERAREASKSSAASAASGGASNASSGSPHNGDLSARLPVPAKTDNQPQSARSPALMNAAANIFPSHVPQPVPAKRESEPWKVPRPLVQAPRTGGERRLSQSKEAVPTAGKRSDSPTKWDLIAWPVGARVNSAAAGNQRIPHSAGVDPPSGGRMLRAASPCVDQLPMPEAPGARAPSPFTARRGSSTSRVIATPRRRSNDIF